MTIPLSTEWPKMIYRAPGDVLLHGVMVEHTIIDTPEQLAEASEHGWCRTPTEAQAAEDARQAASARVEPAVDTPVDTISPPTRAELEAKATELELTFDGRTSDKTLGSRIAAKLKGS